MSKQANTLAFIDLLFNLLLGITFMFIIAFLMINPIAETGKVDPPIKLLVEMEWDKTSSVDIDLWIRGAEGTWIGSRNKDGGYFVLDRDDRGTLNDTVIVNGETVVIQRNYESVDFTLLPAGEYYVNIHHFSGQNEKPGEEVTITITQLQPFKTLYVGSKFIAISQETTVVSFVVDNHGQVTDIRTDVQLPYVSMGGFSSGVPAREDEW